MNSETREILASCNSYSKIYHEKLNFIQKNPGIYTIRHQSTNRDNEGPTDRSKSLKRSNYNSVGEHRSTSRDHRYIFSSNLEKNWGEK